MLPSGGSFTYPFRVYYACGSLSYVLGQSVCRPVVTKSEAYPIIMCKGTIAIEEGCEEEVADLFVEAFFVYERTYFPTEFMD